jgi:hypothetical protein
VGFHNILSKCDQALAAYLISLGIGDETTIYPSKRALDIENPPYTSCVSVSAKTTAQYSGNWTVEAHIETHTNAAPDKSEDTTTMQEDSNDLASQVADAFLSYNVGDQSGSGLAEAITSAAQSEGIEFTALDVKVTEVEQGRTEKQGEWVDTVTLEIICVPSNI